MQEVSFDDFNQNPDKYPTGLEHLYIAMSYDFEENLGDKYEKCKLYRKLFQNFGYTFDFGLDGEPIDLKKIEEQ